MRPYRACSNLDRHRACLLEAEMAHRVDRCGVAGEGNDTPIRRPNWEPYWLPMATVAQPHPATPDHAVLGEPTHPAMPPPLPGYPARSTDRQTGPQGIRPRFAHSRHWRHATTGQVAAVIGKLTPSRHACTAPSPGARRRSRPRWRCGPPGFRRAPGGSGHPGHRYCRPGTLLALKAVSRLSSSRSALCGDSTPTAPVRYLLSTPGPVARSAISSGAAGKRQPRPDHGIMSGSHLSCTITVSRVSWPGKRGRPCRGSGIRARATASCARLDSQRQEGDVHARYCRSHPDSTSGDHDRRMRWQFPEPGTCPFHFHFRTASFGGSGLLRFRVLAEADAGQSNRLEQDDRPAARYLAGAARAAVRRPVQAGVRCDDVFRNRQRRQGIREHDPVRRLHGRAGLPVREPRFVTRPNR